VIQHHTDDEGGEVTGMQMWDIFRVRDYHQHATGAGSDAQAVSFIEAETPSGKVLWGVGMDSNIVAASLKAVTCAANRAAALK
jgi:2-isopropylmalate synthase